MIIPKGKWVASEDGWIQTETGETITEYQECGSHASEFATDGVKALILAAPEMLAVIQELVAGNFPLYINREFEDAVCTWKSPELWERMTELAKRLEHTLPEPKPIRSFAVGAPIDATHWGPETPDYHASWYKQHPNGEWSSLAVQSHMTFGARWYGLGNTLKPERIASLTPLADAPRMTEEEWRGIVTDSLTGSAPKTGLDGELGTVGKASRLHV